jgi:hypothetical protein
LGALSAAKGFSYQARAKKQWGKWERASEKSGGARAIFGDN